MHEKNFEISSNLSTFLWSEGIFQQRFVKKKLFHFSFKAELKIQGQENEKFKTRSNVNFRKKVSIAILFQKNEKFYLFENSIQPNMRERSYSEIFLFCKRYKENLEITNSSFFPDDSWNSKDVS